MDEKLLAEDLEERGLSHPWLIEEEVLGRKLEVFKRVVPLCVACLTVSCNSKTALVNWQLPHAGVSIPSLLPVPIAVIRDCAT
jgi:hypothetical protein